MTYCHQTHFLKTRESIMMAERKDHMSKRWWMALRKQCLLDTARTMYIWTHREGGILSLGNPLHMQALSGVHYVALRDCNSENYYNVMVLSIWSFTWEEERRKGKERIGKQRERKKKTKCASNTDSWLLTPAYFISKTHEIMGHPLDRVLSKDRAKRWAPLSIIWERQCAFLLLLCH